MRRPLTINCSARKQALKQQQHIATSQAVQLVRFGKLKTPRVTFEGSRAAMKGVA